MGNISVHELLGGHYHRSHDSQVAKLALKGLAAQPGGYVLAVDFDGTLCEERYPEIGDPLPNMIGRVKTAQKYGIKIVLWTCREGEKLNKALAWCEEQGLVFDAVNDNTEERKALYGNNPRKIGYDELWDDRAA